MAQQLCEHFSNIELACHCGCGTIPGPEFLEILEALRVRFGHPMILTSAARCPTHNAEVSTTGRTGPHVIDAIASSFGMGAIDVNIQGARAVELLELAMGMGSWTGFGINQSGPHESRFIHLDNVHVGRMIWSY